MAVPITFIDKWNPDEFKIIGITKSYFDNGEIFKNNTKSYDAILNGKRIFGRLIIKKA